MKRDDYTITWYREPCVINGSAINTIPQNVWFKVSVI